MSRFIQGATWSDCGHLTQEAQDALWDSIPEYQRDARAKGIPQLGAGAVYPFAESQIKITDFPIPPHYVKGFGMDCALSGTTAVAWGAMDRETGVTYLYAVYRRAQAETAIHVEAIKSHGAWVPGVGDAAGVIDADRSKHIDKYRQHGIDLELPDKSVEPGITDVYDALSQGQLKVFASCAAWFEEFRVYRRNEKGQIVKKNDHVMDATRYLYRSGRQRMKVKPPDAAAPERYVWSEGSGMGLEWMR